ncbi:MAG: flippase [Anaerolineae bacterium]|nr:flippase [Anaerolineae bacterium]
MNFLKSYRLDFLIICGFFVLPLLLFWDVTVGGQTMLPVDNLWQWAPWAANTAITTPPQNPLITDLIIQNYAWKQFIRENISTPTQLLWNPYLFGGVPFLAAGQHGAYYPFSLLFLILPLSKAYGWYAVSQIWLAGVLMYVYGRTVGMRRSSAALAGLVYQGGGYLVVSAVVFPMISGAVVWLPLLLACIDKVISGSIRRARSTWLWLMLGAAALGTQIPAGHIEFTIYTLLVMAVYALWQVVAGGWWLVAGGTDYRLRITDYGLRPLLYLTGMVLLGLMLGAIQLIPLYELGQANFREAASSLAEVRGYAFPMRQAVTLALPNFFGNPAHQEVVDVFSRQTIPITQNYYGQPISTTEWSTKNYVEGGIYLGILPLFLAILGIYGGLRKVVSSKQLAVRGRRGLTSFYLLLAFFSLTFIFGTPLYALLYYGLPFVNQLHTPFRWVFPLSLAVAVLAGFGADYLAATRKWQTIEVWKTYRQSFDKAQNKSPVANLQSQNVFASDSSVVWWLRPFVLWGTPSIITGLAGVAFWAGTAVLIGLFISKILYAQIAPLVERTFLGLALAAYAFPDAQTFYSYEYRQVFLFGLMLVGTGATLRVSRCPIFAGRWGGRWPLWLFMAAGLIVLDIWAANRGFHAANDPALLVHKPELVEWLEAQPGLWRLTSFAPHGDKPFNANSGWLFDLPDVRGYDSIIPKQYTNYMSAIEPQNELPFNRVQPIVNWQSLNSPLLDVLGVKYVITAETIELPKYHLAWQGEGLNVYENLGVAPRAYTLPQKQTAVVPDPLAALTTQYDPRQFVVIAENNTGLPITNYRLPITNYQPADIIANSNIEVTVQTAVTKPSWLILNDSYFPGWKAFVKQVGAGEDAEQQVDITLVNGNFRGVRLEPGEWEVRFRYSPLSFQLGGLASAMAVVILMFGTAVWGWRIFYNPSGDLSKTHSIAKNSLAPMALNLFNKFIDFVFAMFYLRALGPAGAGSFQTAIVTAGIFDIVANYGLDLLFIRDVSHDRRKTSSYLLNTTVLRIGLAFFAALPVFVLIFVTNRLPDSNPLTPAEILATILIMAGMVFSGMSKGVTGLFYVHEEAETPAAMTTATTIMKVGFGVLVLLAGYSFLGLAAVSILTNVLTLFILVVLALRKYDLPGPWRLDWGLQRRMLRLGFPLMLIHLLQTIFISIDTYLLRVMLPNGQEVAGWYSSAYKWFNALQIIPSFFTLALFPIITREIQQSPESARRMYGMAIKIMYLLALPVAAVTWYLAVPLVRIVGGPEFLPHGAIALQIVIWSIPIGWMNSVTNYVLIGLGLEGKQPRAFTTGVLFNIVTNLLFIPLFTYVAAGVTTILSEVVLLLVFAYYLGQRMPGVGWRFMVKPGVITAVTVLIMYLGGQIHLLVGVWGILLYPAGLLLLRVVGPAERKILADILPAPLARRLRLV